MLLRRVLKSLASFLFLVLLSSLLLAAAKTKFTALPAPVSNSAVASMKVKGTLMLYSFMGIGPQKTWNATTNAAYAFDTDEGKWLQIRPVPGIVGRIAAVAAGAREQVFLFGGYVVDAQGMETTVPDLNVYEPLTDRWYRGADIPVPVNDSAVGVYRDRYVYLISGRSNNRTVGDVQIYDAEKDRWLKGTPITGIPVFGHAGGIVGDTMVYIDGARANPASPQPRYLASDECWMGKIDHHDPTKITWSKLPSHPGNAHYRIAAGASEKDGRIYFSGGSEIPYHYNGIGYNGQPAEPSPVTFAFNVKTGHWETLNEHTPDPTMDHRGLLVTPHDLVLLGGMEKGQQVTAKVQVIPKK